MEQQQRQHRADQHITAPEQQRVKTAVHEQEAFEGDLFGVVQVGQVVDRHQVQRGGDEDTQQPGHAAPDRAVEPAALPRIHRGLGDQEDRQAPTEAQHDEQRRQQRRLVSLARDQEGEDRAGAGGQHEAPDQGRQAGRLRIHIHAPLEHRPQVDRDDGRHARVEEDVPGEDRFEVVVRGGDDHAIGPTQVQHQHHQAAHQQGDAQQTRERRARLVDRLAEDRADRGDVEHPRGRDDHEDREHMGQAPDDLVVHAGDDVAV
ncbi:hypothetical protein FQZ97_813440 [compost metagenome]